jgi:epoxyqueuosine reductase QueG
MTDSGREREAIERIALEAGAVVFGVADVGEVEDVSGEVSLADLVTGISFGYRLSDVVLDGIEDCPTRTYQYHYRQVNLLLDRIGLLVMTYLQERGHRAFPVPSSQIVDWEKNLGHISHRAVAECAGLGWRGRNNLLVNPVHGARVRYSTVLTDLVLPYDRRIEDGCGSCRSCVKACPGGAIGESPAEFDLERCVETIRRISRVNNIGSQICGICVKACRGRRLPPAA